jgi:hypothetical protein
VSLLNGSRLVVFYYMVRALSLFANMGCTHHAHRLYLRRLDSEDSLGSKSRGRLLGAFALCASLASASWISSPLHEVRLSLQTSSSAHTSSPTVRTRSSTFEVETHGQSDRAELLLLCRHGSCPILRRLRVRMPAFRSSIF